MIMSIPALNLVRDLTCYSRNNLFLSTIQNGKEKKERKKPPFPSIKWKLRVINKEKQDLSFKWPPTINTNIKSSRRECAPLNTAQ